MRGDPNFKGSDSSGLSVDFYSVMSLTILTSDKLGPTMLNNMAAASIILTSAGQYYLQNIVQCCLHLPKEDTLGTAYSKGIA